MAAEPEAIWIDYLEDEYAVEEDALEVDSVVVEPGKVSTTGLTEVLSRVDEDESVAQLVDVFMGRVDELPYEYSKRDLSTVWRIVEADKDKNKPKNWQTRFKSAQGTRHNKALVEARLDRRMSKN